MIGIYKITSPSNRVYIGQSVNIERRWFKHRSLTDSHKSSRLCSSFKKYDVKNHIFEVLEECSVELLNERERFYQDKFDVLGPKGLNCKLTEAGELSGYRSIELKKRMSEAHLNRSPEQKEITKKKRSETFSKRTVEERQKTRSKILETQLNRTQEEKQRIIDKIKLTKKNKSPEERQRIRDKVKLTKESKTPEENQRTKDKKAATIARKTSEERIAYSKKQSEIMKRVLKLKREAKL